MSDKQTAVSTAELMRRAEADAARRDWQDHLEREEMGSPDAEEARWSGILGRMRWERPEVWHDERPAIDSRLFATEGDLVEQARRDADRHGFPGGDAA